MIQFSAHRMLHTARGPLPLDISFDLETGKCLCLFGPSGAGKTTVLRIMAGLMTMDRGYLAVDGQVWYDGANRINRPPQARSVGMLFQDFALFPNLTVKQNISVGLSKHNPGPFLDEMLDLMDLRQLQNQKPRHLSGGQKQRVALARALARRPSVLLLDEPLSAIDESMRMQLQTYLAEIQRHYHCTTVLVSHHIPEIMELADEVLRIDQGQMVDKGRPADLFRPQQRPGLLSGPLCGHVTQILPTASQYIIQVSTEAGIVEVLATSEDLARLQTGTKVILEAGSPGMLPTAAALRVIP